MNDFKEVGEAIARIFTQFHWVYVLEGLLCFLLIYTVLKILVENNAKRLVVTYTLVLLLVGFVSLFSEVLDITTFCAFLLMFSVFFLLLFNVEIKRSVWNIKKGGSTVKESAPKKKVGVRAEEYISGIVKAVQNLSKSNTGALIVRANGNLPKEIVESCVQLNSNISSQLI